MAQTLYGTISSVHVNLVTDAALTSVTKTSDKPRTGPETVDRALIGTTRKYNPVTKTVDFTRYSNNGQKDHVPDPSQRESVIYRLHPELEGRRLIHQIGTASPELAVQAASLIAQDVVGIDVNAGCPKPFSTLGGMGAALLKTPDTLCAILRALVEEVGIPNEIGISVKIRILDTEEQTRDLVAQLVQTGITGLTVHCRTTPMRPRERAIRDARLKAVVEVCHEAGVACLMNGDVTCRDEALKLAEEFGADGAMIATAAETNPSCFRSKADGGISKWEPVVADYMAYALDVENRWGNTKYLLGQMMPGKSPKYNPMKRSKSYFEVVEILGLQETLGEKAKEVDKRLGMGDEVEGEKKLTKAERRARNRAEQEVAEKRRAEEKKNQQATAQKRKADEADLEDIPKDMKRQAGPGSVPEQASVLAV
ncbi:tRNA-dihydrouridine synthase-like protein [Elsinoe australis]|uniref:tRNA-dihydrouridine synthase-like protein n=1 Tax=Elsinoe australis TaxID=40998 RepID=A0A4U7BEX8_9PEZI|nr:tRNA-dihydrouridine synthase-like protein [Elsinoe australis]